MLVVKIRNIEEDPEPEGTCRYEYQILVTDKEGNPLQITGGEVQHERIRPWYVLVDNVAKDGAVRAGERIQRYLEAFGESLPDSKKEGR